MSNTPSEADYRHAQQILWGDAGAWAADTFAELNAEFFGDEIPARGVVWGLTPHGHTLGHTNSSTGRITLHPALLDPHSDAWGQEEFLGDAYARDVLLHEMIHALLLVRGASTDHNEAPWCGQVERLAPLLGLGTVKAAPVKPRRIQGQVRRQALPGHLERAELAGFPHSLRAPAFYTSNKGRMRVRI